MAGLEQHVPDARRRVLGCQGSARDLAREQVRAADQRVERLPAQHLRHARAPALQLAEDQRLRLEALVHERPDPQVQGVAPEANPVHERRNALADTLDFDTRPEQLAEQHPDRRDRWGILRAECVNQTNPRAITASAGLAGTRCWLNLASSESLVVVIVQKPLAGGRSARHGSGGSAAHNTKRVQEHAQRTLGPCEASQWASRNQP
jgi:hypothetical protein